MFILFAVFSTLLLALYLRERAINRKLNEEVLYVKERLAKVSVSKENGYVLIPSENRGIRELSVQLNCLLENFYLQKADYCRSKQAMEQVLANISHDLRTPLTVLKGYSELLIKEIRNRPGLSTIQDMAARIDQKADELVQTINEYFTMAKIESGDMKIDLCRTNVTQVCHETILDYYDILEKEQYEVDIRIDGAPVMAYADEDALKRILKNLIDNAVKHGRDGRYLGFRLRDAEGKIVIEVEDHGAGIADKDQEQLFRRNYTSSRGGAGSGLGLAIARSLVLLMGGEIAVCSEPNVKTVFTVVLQCNDMSI